MPTNSWPASAAAAPPRRLRNTILQALELFERLDLPRGFHCVSVFLYVCENEGLTITELSALTGSAVSVVARTVRIMAGEQVEGQAISTDVLIDLQPSPDDRRVKLVFLTEAGVRLRDRLDDMIRSAQTIVAHEAA